jgi:hypothetical protein
MARTISAGYGSGVTLALGDDPVSVTATGSIGATNAAALLSTGTVDRTITNAGTIAASGSGVASVGIQLKNGTASAGGTISNSGTIAGGQFGIYSNQAVTLANAGTIGATAATSGVAVVLGTGRVENAGGITGARYGIYMIGAGSLANTGTITGSTNAGVVLNGGGTLTNSAPAAHITGARIGVYLYGAGAVANAGTISGTGTAGYGAQMKAGGRFDNQASGSVTGTAVGVVSSGTLVTTIANAGAIQGSTHGVGVVGAVAAVENAAGGQITGIGGSGVLALAGGGVDNAGTVTGRFGIRMLNAVGTVTNSGSVASTGRSTPGLNPESVGAGVQLGAGGTIVNNAGGRISGYWIGAQIGNFNGTNANGGTILNAGVITANDPGVSGAAVWMKGEGLISNAATGTIGSGPYGIVSYNKVTIVNRGTIFGTDHAVFTSAVGNGDRIIVYPGASFSGTVMGDAAAAPNPTGVLELAAGATSGTIAGFGSKYIGFARVEVGAGATWSLAGTVVAAQTIALSGPGAALTLANPGSVAGTITGFAPSTQLVLGGITDITASSVGAGNVLSLTRAAGGTISLTFDPATNLAGGVGFVADGSGTTLSAVSGGSQNDSSIITPLDGAASDLFGVAVSLSADGLTAIVGGLGDDVGSNSEQGSARVFVWNGAGWVQRGAALTPTDGAAEDWFGQSVSLSADGFTAIVGGRLDDLGTNINQGSARVFVWSGAGWMQRGAALTPTDGAAGDNFGFSVSLSADGLTAIVGGFQDDVGSNSDQGSARVFVWHGTEWVQRGSALTPTDGASDDWFGYSVSLSGDGLAAIVGAPSDDVGTNNSQGSARVFVWNGNEWVQRGAPLTPVDGAVEDNFGYSVSLSSDGLTAIVGGYDDDVGSNSKQGSARVFVWNGAGWVQRGGPLTPADGAADDYFGVSVSLSADGLTAIVGGQRDNVGSNSDQGSARVFVWNGATWLQRGGALTPTDGAADDTFGKSVALSADGLIAIVGGHEDDVGSNGDQGTARIFSWNGLAWIEGVPAPATLGIASNSVAQLEGNSGSTAYTFTVTRSGDTNQSSTANWAVTGSGGSPAAAADFVGGELPSGTVSFASGETSKAITVLVAGDGTIEPDEGFTVTLNGASAGTQITAASATGTIINDDVLTVAQFGTPVTLIAGNFGVFSLAVSDFNEDGAPDLALSINGTKIGVALNDKKGGFSVPSSITVGGVPDRLSAADLNGDGHADLIVSHSDAIGGTSVLLGKGDGSFGAPSRYVTQGYSHAVAADVDNDGDPDLVVTNRVTAFGGPANSTVSILFNDGAGAFTATGTTYTPGTGFGLAVADFNFDGKADILTSSESGQAGVMLGDGTGGFAATLITSIPFGYEFAVGDVNEDGKPDLVTADVSADTVSVFVADGKGTFLPPTSYATGDFPRGIALADLNGDASLDVLVGNEFASSVSVLYGHGDGTFAPRQDYAAITSASFVAAADLNGDSFKDIIVGSLANGAFNVLNGSFPQSLSISATDALDAEGNSGSTAYTFTVTRSGYSNQASTANWAVTGTGINPAAASDFVGGILPTGMVSFASGETSKAITVLVAGDTAVEADESFTVTLSGASAGTQITTAVASGGIVNDDTAGSGTGQLSITRSFAVRSEGHSASTEFSFLVTRSGDISGSASSGFAVTGGGGTGTGAATANDFAGNTLPAGVVSFASGETSKFITVNVAGDTASELNEGFTLTLANPALGVTIATASAVGIIYNDDTPGTGTLSIARASAQKPEGNDGATPFTFTITRSGTTAGTASVDWAVTPGGIAGTGAIDGSDLVGGIFPNGRVVFAAGQTAKTITVNIAGERAVEADESFTIALSGAQAGTTIGTASATGLLVNDDIPGTGILAIARQQAARAEGQSGSTAFTFLVTRSGDASGAARATWAVTGGSVAGTVAANGADFIGGKLPAGTVNFTPGATIATVTANVAGDVANELNESFNVTLSNPAPGVGIATAAATGVIHNDDTAGTGTLSIARASAQKAEGHTGTTAFTFTVTRSGDITGTASSDWAVTGGGVTSTTAAIAADFAGSVMPSGRVSFAALQTKQTIVVNVAGDSAVELNDSFTVTLAAPQAGVALGAASATGVILNDDFASTAANQTLTGTAAADMFLLGGGLDSVSGKGGADSFRFLPSAIGPAAGNATTLQDFSRVAGEMIDLSAIDAIAGNLVDDAFTFIGAAAFSGAPGELRWEDLGTSRLIQGNVNADTTADLTIFVKAAGPVDAGWFVL